MLGVLAGIVLILCVLQDSFESIVLPRRVPRRFRLARLFTVLTWSAWSRMCRLLPQNSRRDVLLSYYGPLSMIGLLVMWASGLILGFALILWGGSVSVISPEHGPTFWTYLYFSGTTFITLGLGDVTPVSFGARALACVEAGIGFGFLALIIGYVPVIYQAFSRREIGISLLDAHASSPATALEWLRRHAGVDQRGDLTSYLREWEHWSADLLESHLSYPVLTFYRSQHEHQSWIGMLTMIMDTCTVLLVGLEELSLPVARFTFAMARHATVDLAQNYRQELRRSRAQLPPSARGRNDAARLGVVPAFDVDRMPHDDFIRLRDRLDEVGLHFSDPEHAEERLREIRQLYEPFVISIAERLLVTLPPWVPATPSVDDWQTSAWDHFSPWSPAKIAKVTHMIVEGKNRMLQGREVETDHLDSST